MKCDEVKLVFDSYLCGEAGDRASRLVEDHLAACPECYQSLLCVNDAELDAALTGDWYAAEPPSDFSTKVLRSARVRFITSGARWLIPLWLLYAAATTVAGLWLALGRSIFGVSLGEIIGIARTVRSVAQTLGEAFSLVNINEAAVFLLAMSCFVSLALIRYAYKEVLLWTKD